jgi:hypothetical protein
VFSDWRPRFFESTLATLRSDCRVALLAMPLAVVAVSLSAPTLRAESGALRGQEGAKFCIGPNLFIDDYLVAESRGLKRTTHQPERRPEPVLKQDQPMLFMKVLYDADLARYRMWYNANGVDGGRGIFQAYAESRDGVAWQTPGLGLIKLPGTHPNNAIDAPRGHFGMFLIDEGPGFADPSRRYKLAWFDQSHQNQKDGMCIAFSADGMRFREYEGNPVLPRYAVNGEESVHVSDAIEGCWDPMKKQYIAGCKIWGTGYPGQARNAPPGWRRMVGVITSKDFVRWEGPRVALTPDRDTMDEINAGKIIVRGNLYLAFLRVLRDDLAATPGQPVGGVGTTELATSRDGQKWIRYRDKFIDRDPRPGTWNHAMSYYADSITVGDKEYIYISGNAVGHKTRTDRTVGMAISRKNGFVSRDAGSETGLLKTPPAMLPGNYFTANANVREEMRVRLLDTAGKVFPGFDWTDCVPVRGDSVSHRIEWRGRPELPSKQPVSIEFSLKNTELYGFDFAQID